MSDELKAAAERIADNIECASQVRWESDSHRADAIRNIEVGLLRYSGSLPDDDTSIDADWLKSVGFFDFCEAANGFAYLSISSADGIPRIAVHWADGDKYWSVNRFSLTRVAWPETRGQLRRLASALGISLKEVVT